MVGNRRGALRAWALAAPPPSSYQPQLLKLQPKLTFNFKNFLLYNFSPEEKLG